MRRSVHPPYKRHRKSWGINAMGSMVVEASQNGAVTRRSELFYCKISGSEFVGIMFCWRWKPKMARPESA